MDFGRVSVIELDAIDFKLPPDSVLNDLVLTSRPVKQPKVYIGCPKWGRKEWVGTLYPPGTKDKDFLDEYVRHFNSVELNATHYKMYDEATIQKWADKAGDHDFVFCPKIYKGISHYGNLKNKQEQTENFLNALRSFGDHLGPVFIQVNENFSPNRMEELIGYLSTLPKDISFFVEVRHPAFFAKETIEQLCGQLIELQIGLVLTDAAGRRDCLHMCVTIPKVFIRFVGNNLHPTDYTRVDEWGKRLKSWFDNGLAEAYIMVHLWNEFNSPKLISYMIDQLNSTCNMHLKEPKPFK